MSGRDQYEMLAMAAGATGAGLRTCELLALDDAGATAIVQDGTTPGGPLLRARTIVDLQAAHIGREVLLAVMPGAAGPAVVLGLLRGGEGRDARPSPLRVEADGERFVVQASQQLVLRCGKASITLTQAGKVLIDGTHVVSRSTGANRVKGASVQLN